MWLSSTTRSTVYSWIPPGIHSKLSEVIAGVLRWRSAVAVIETDGSLRDRHPGRPLLTSSTSIDGLCRYMDFHGNMQPGSKKHAPMITRSRGAPLRSEHKQQSRPRTLQLVPYLIYRDTFSPRFAFVYLASIVCLPSTPSSLHGASKLGTLLSCTHSFSVLRTRRQRHAIFIPALHSLTFYSKRLAR